MSRIFVALVALMLSILPVAAEGNSQYDFSPYIGEETRFLIVADMPKGERTAMLSLTGVTLATLVWQVQQMAGAQLDAIRANYAAAVAAPLAAVQGQLNSPVVQQALGPETAAQLSAVVSTLGTLNGLMAANQQLQQNLSPTEQAALMQLLPAGAAATATALQDALAQLEAAIASYQALMQAPVKLLVTWNLQNESEFFSNMDNVVAQEFTTARLWFQPATGKVQGSFGPFGFHPDRFESAQWVFGVGVTPLVEAYEADLRVKAWTERLDGSTYSVEHDKKHYVVYGRGGVKLSALARKGDWTVAVEGAVNDAVRVTGDEVFEHPFEDWRVRGEVTFNFPAPQRLPQLALGEKY